MFRIRIDLIYYYGTQRKSRLLRKYAEIRAGKYSHSTQLAKLSMHISIKQFETMQIKLSSISNISQNIHK